MPNIVIFGITTTCAISKLSQLYHNFEISLLLFMPNVTTNHAITYTYTVVSAWQTTDERGVLGNSLSIFSILLEILLIYNASLPE